MATCNRSDSACMLPSVADLTDAGVPGSVADGRGGRTAVLLLAPTEHTLLFNNGAVTTVLQTSAHVAGRHQFRELGFVFSHYGDHCARLGLAAAQPGAAQSAKPSSPSNSTQSNKPDVAFLLAQSAKRSQVPKLSQDSLIIVQTFQRSQSDLMVINDVSNHERNVLLECFSSWGRYVITRIRDQGYWADMTDPCSGYPVYTPRGTSLYPDVDGASMLLKYPTHLVGCCRIISHPVWGTRNYPATLFTTCPLDVLQSVLEDSYKSHHSF
ncbi:UNVERIFIED_CONTAM: hypothetical protein HDU68_000322 [Siphonaria sp. JEL0065]|nr:hypothetical protein HDU68_000322 [Siphonaria sp. JEL0065]